MIRSLLAIGVLCAACGSSTDSSPAGGNAGGTASDSSPAGGNAGSASPDASLAGGNAGGNGNGGVPDLSGSWQVTAHCDASLIGARLTVTQSGESLSFAAPFDTFSGSVSADGTITLSGPQSCTGTASASAVSMNCTPGTCVVKLAR